MSSVLPFAVRSIVLGFLGSLAAVIAYRLLTGEINTYRLLRSKAGPDAGALSPTRIQLLLFTLWTAGNYFGRTINGLGASRMPDVPESWLVALGSSHLVYLGTKAYAFFGAQPGSIATRPPPKDRPW
jgi:hypothetical protein